MKKFLNYLLAIVGIVYLVVLAIFQLNINLGDYQIYADYMKNYGAPAIIGALAIVNVIGKGIFKVIMTIVVILGIAVYVLAMACPQVFSFLGIGTTEALIGLIK